MKCNAIYLIVVWLGLSVGNFAYEAMFDHEWGVDAERSFFQGIAILASWWFVMC